jgi:uncharacterized damage-inducible protein DinB
MGTVARRQSTELDLDTAPRIRHDAHVDEIDSFPRYWTRLKQRTFTVAELVPEDRIEWSPGHGVMTFGDIVRHLAVIERWMFVETLLGRKSRYVGHGRELASGREQVLAFARQLHAESLRELKGLTAADRNRLVTTPAEAQLPVWSWLRAMCEHEAHHRGQLYLMLRLMDVPTPPIFGLTAEDLRRRGIVTAAADPVPAATRC